jgi:hypothetical protein
MSSVSDLIHSSFRLIGAIAAGETLETNELNDAFISLNQMLASWNTEGASVVGRSNLEVPLTPGLNGYTLSQRPVKIDAATASISGVDNALEIVDAAGWEAIPIPEKQMQSIFLRKLYCNYLYPTTTVYVWPVPRIGGWLEMWIYSPMTAFTDVNQVIDLPPGYEIALRYNFAVALLPEYPRSQADPSLPAQAQMYKASIVQLNTSNHMRSAPAVPGVPAGTAAQQGNL